ncbi:hypothetical protein C8R44DRAFT_747720 [Mycena epipterygia]|nr:hypothetical protein C8R44DRAFT_747720 [Mycena epipterygia]
MPSSATAEFTVLPGIRDMFPEHFSPRRPQLPTEPHRAPLGPAPPQNHFFGVLKHDPRSASLDAIKPSHPLPDPKRWYSPPVHALSREENAEGRVDGVMEKQVDREEVAPDNLLSVHRRKFSGAILPLCTRRKSRSLRRLLRIDAVPTPCLPAAVPPSHLPADELVSSLWRVAGAAPGATTLALLLALPSYDVEQQLIGHGAFQLVLRMDGELD